MSTAAGTGIMKTMVINGKSYEVYDDKARKDISTLSSGLSNSNSEISGIKTNIQNNYLKKTDISEWAKAETKPEYTSEEIGSYSKGETYSRTETDGKIDNKISTHNSSAESHADIRTSISNLNTQLGNTKTLPNPHSIEFTGGIQFKYDGSKEVSVEVPTIIGIDKTLEVEDSAADAKVVGTAIKNIKDNINNNYLKKTDVGEWAKESEKPTYTYNEVGAEQSGTVENHNNSIESHQDIRTLIANLIERIEALENANNGEIEDPEATA